MLRRREPISGQRFAHWICVVFCPIVVVLTLASPQPHPWWHYLAIPTWSLIGIRSAYWLVKDRPLLG
jgi:hypothetical protein